MLHGRFLFFNPADIRPARTLPQLRGEIGEFIGWSGGVDLHAAIVEIARVAGESQPGCGALGEVAKADALDASANHPAAADKWFSPHALIVGPARSGEHALCEQYSGRACRDLPPLTAGREIRGLRIPVLTVEAQITVKEDPGR